MRASGHLCSGRRVDPSLASGHLGCREVSDDGDGCLEGPVCRLPCARQFGVGEGGGTWEAVVKDEPRKMRAKAASGMMPGFPDCATEETAPALGAWEHQRREDQACGGGQTVSLLSSRLRAGAKRRTDDLILW